MYLPDGSLNVPELRQWILDAPAVKPLAPQNGQGMTSFRDVLSEDDLDALVAYLSTLGEAPILPEGISPADASES